MLSTDKTKKSPPPLVGVNINLESKPKSRQRIVECKECNKSLNAKSLARHMRDIHQQSGPGKPKAWIPSDSGWVRNNSNSSNDAEKRKREGNFSPSSEMKAKKEARNQKTPPSKITK